MLRCEKCGAANDGKEKICGQCHAELPLAVEGGAKEVNPNRDYTVISDSNIFPENIINGRFKIIRVLGRDLDGRSDIFSFGVVLAELLTGKNPFSDRNNTITQYNILHKEIKLGAAIAPALRKIVRKALQKDRERCYSDFREIKKDLATARKSAI